jgi:capsular polysaccharide transport system permease protein
LVTKLDGEVATLNAQRQALAASAPQSPELVVLDQQIRAYQDQVDKESAKVAGQDTSLAPLIGEYERLTIDRDFAAKELAVASSAVESATLDVRRKHLYLERIVPPNMPDSPGAPRRFYSMFIELVTSLLIYGVIVLILAGFREHGQT